MKIQWKWLLVLGVAAAGLLAWRRTRKPGAESGDRYAFRVSRGKFDVKVEAVGTVEPENRVPLLPTLSGRLDRMLVAEGDAVSKGQVLAWMSSNERAAFQDAMYLRSSTDTLRAAIDDAVRAIPIIAPISGTVIQRTAEPGQPVGPNASVLVISDRLIIRAFVDETDLNSLREGQKALYILDSMPEKKLSAQVLHISYEAHQVNMVTASEVQLLPLDAPRELRPGMNATVEILARTKNGALSIPKGALKYVNGKATVQLPGAQAPSVRGIEVGLVNRSNVEVLAGLSEGETVLVASDTAKDDGSMTMSIGAN
jgi:macrolide-specific efflux system membrane fusion protein